jgi:two-component system chemotaxis sensor kinase CheA
MQIAGELVLVRNQLQILAAAEDNPRLRQATQELNSLTAQLQEGVMRTRMQPIRMAWDKLPRVVRNLAREQGKEIEFDMHGADTQVDRSVIEAIKSPLTHAVRNAVDHGMESVPARLGGGKPARGSISISARHANGQVIIAVEDDGRGIDPGAVRLKALQNSLISTDQAGSMSDTAILDLIFEPGFSTAEAVTRVSGRGVGMDVVRSNIEDIGGSVEIASRVGKGTQLTLRLPLTLAVVPVLLVRARRQAFAISQLVIRELLSLSSKQLDMLGDLDGAPVLLHRSGPIPLVYLSQQLKLGSKPTESADLHIVICETDSGKFGIAVDSIQDTREIVVKPPGYALRQISTFAGTAVLSDGTIPLVLDITTIARHAGVAILNAALDEHFGEASSITEEPEERMHSNQLLTFTTHEGRILALPAGRILHIKQFDRFDVESADGHRIVRYQGVKTPLIDLDKFFAESPTPQRQARMNVIMYHYARAVIGLVVHQVQDLGEVEYAERRAADTPGVEYELQDRERRIEVVDLDAVINDRHAGFFEWIAEHVHGAISE